MRIRLALCLLLLMWAGLASAAAPAKVYKWTDANGTVHFSPTPPDEAAQEVKLQKAPKAAPAAAPEVVATPTTAERCAQHRDNLKLLEAEGKTLSIEVDGKLRPLNAEEREEQLAAARAALALCEQAPPAS